MCSRHAEVGAGDPETMAADRTMDDYIPPPTYLPFSVLVEDFDGGRVKVRVNAMGPNDARGLARQKAIDLGYDVAAVLRVEEAAA